MKLKRNENNLLGCRWSTLWFSVTQFLLTRAQEKEEFFFLISPFCQKSFFCPLLWFYLLPPTALSKVCLPDLQLYLILDPWSRFASFILSSIWWAASQLNHHPLLLLPSLLSLFTNSQTSINFLPSFLVSFSFHFNFKIYYCSHITQPQVSQYLTNSSLFLPMSIFSPRFQPAPPQIKYLPPPPPRHRLLFRYTAFDRLKFRFSLDLEVGKLISFSHPTDIWIFQYKPYLSVAKYQVSYCTISQNEFRLNFFISPDKGVCEMAAYFWNFRPQSLSRLD